MANQSVAYEVSATWYDPRSVYWTPDYLKKLLIERHNIRAAIENPGGSVITAGAAQAADADNLPSYSSVIGNDFHLDLLEAEREVNTLELTDRIELLAWCDGLTPKQAAQWANIKGGHIRKSGNNPARKRLQRTVAKVAGQAEANNDVAA
jgi:hypothetical protein